MKWIGSHIWDWISRFRNDVYLEDTSTGTIASGGNLGLDSNNKIVKNTVSSAKYFNRLISGYKFGIANTSYYTFYRPWYENWSNVVVDPTSASYSNAYYDGFACFFIAPRAGKITGIKIQGIFTASTSRNDDFKFHFLKKTLSHNEASTGGMGLSTWFTTTAIDFGTGGNAETTAGSNRTWKYEEDFADKTFAEGERLFIFLRKEAHTGSWSGYFTISIDGEYT